MRRPPASISSTIDTPQTAKALSDDTLGAFALHAKRCERDSPRDRLLVDKR